MSLQIAVQSLSHISSSHLGKPLTCISTSPPVTTQRAMARQTGLTRHWNSTSGSTVTTNRTTGRIFPLVEFTYNNAPSATTTVSPFFANKGYHPNISVYPECDMTSARARDYAVNLELLHQYLHEEMANAKLHYQVPADAKHALALDFKVGDQVYVKAKYSGQYNHPKSYQRRTLGPTLSQCK